MKKIFLFLFIFFIYYNYSYSNWYGTHSKSYSHSYSSSHKTECDSDGDTSGGLPAGYNGKDRRVLVGGGAPSSGYMSCQYWDGANPTASMSPANKDRTNQNISIRLYSGDTGGSGLKHSKYRWNNSNCWVGTNYSNGNQITLSTEGEYTLYLCVEDIAGNTYTTSGVFKIDKTDPTADDIVISPSAGGYYKATNFKQFTINVDNNSSSGGAPIVDIQASFEKYNDKNSFYYYSSNTGTLIQDLNISKVDIDRNSNGYRDYLYKITRVCDQAGNCTNDIKNYNIHVYANDINIANSSVSGQNNFSNQVADGTSKLLKVILKDQYNNQIVQVKNTNDAIIRNVEVGVNYNNSLYLNQANNSGQTAVFSNTSDYIIEIGSNKITKIKNQSNGIYNIIFNVYSPTNSSSATDGRQFATGNFNINRLYGSVSDITGDKELLTDLDFQFKPLYKIDMSGDVIDNGLREGTIQETTLDLTKNSTVNTNDFKLYFSKYGTNNSYFTGTGKVSGIGTNNDVNISTTIPGNIFYNGENFNILSTLFYLSSNVGYLNDIEELRVNGYLGYNISGKNVKYLFGKLNENSKQFYNTLKIYGMTNIDEYKQKDLLENQDNDDINNKNFNLTKSLLKRDIKKNVYLFTKLLDIDNGEKEISNLQGDEWNDVNDGKKVKNILYFGDLGGDNVILEANSDNTGKKTIVVVGGNLYIKSNIVNQDDNDILGIIVLKDDNGNGGNLYIDPSVTKLDAIIYLEKSIISYNEIYGELIMSNNYYYILGNQLYIYGILYSDNTIGGSRKNPPVCPFYVDSCDIDSSQKYDLNYLRSGINNKYNVNYDDYPVIIHYNPLIINNKPPLFEY